VGLVAGHAVGRQAALRFIVEVEIAEHLPGGVFDDEAVRAPGSSKVVRSGTGQAAMPAPRRQTSPAVRLNGHYYDFGSGFIM